MVEFQYKNVECHNYGCEDRKWLKETGELNKVLQIRNDDLNKKINDMKKMIQAKEVKWTDTKVQEVAQMNIELESMTNTLEQENEGYKREVIILNEKLEDLKVKMKDRDEQEVKSIMEFRKTEKDKGSLINEVKDLEIRKRQLKTSNEVLDGFKVDLVQINKTLRTKIEALENDGVVLESKIKQRQKHIDGMDKNVFKLLSFKNRFHLMRINKAERLIKKKKIDKAKKLLVLMKRHQKRPI